MGDPFSVAASVVSVVGFAGQVAQGIQYLHGVLNDIKHAPDFIKKTRSNLRLLETILLEANQVTVPSDKEQFVKDAYQQCKDEVDALVALVKKYEPSVGDGKMKKRIKGMRAGFMAKEFEKSCAGIERVKATLEIVLVISHIYVTRDLHETQRSDTQKLNDKLADLAKDVGSFSGSTFISSTSIQVRSHDINAGIGVSYQGEDDNTSPKPTGIHNNVVKVESTKDGDEEDEKFEEALEYLGPEMGRCDTSTLVCSDPFLNNQNPMLPLDKLPTTLISSDRYSVARTRGWIRLGFGSIQWSTTRSVERRPNGEIRRSSYYTAYKFLPSLFLYTGGIQLLCRWNSIYGGLSMPWGTLRPVTRVPDDAPIIQAVQRGHLVKVIELISSGQASVHDVDTSGTGLLEHAICAKFVTPNCVFVTDMVLARYLIRCGAESAKAMPAIYEQQCQLRQQEVLDCRAHLGDLVLEGYSEKGHATEVKKAWKELEDIARLCLDKAVEDPYQDPDLPLKMWKSSEVSPWSTPIDSFYLYHDNWPIDIEDLALKYPTEVFSILLMVEVFNPRDQRDLIDRLDRRYSTLAALYNAGIPSQAFEKKPAKSDHMCSSPLATGGFCRSANRHLIHLLIATSNLLRYETRYRETVRQHIRRMLVLLLKNGEDPHLRCSCTVLWDGNEGELRTPTDLAIGRNLLDTWNEALKEAGFEASELAEDRIISLPVQMCLGVWNDFEIKGQTSGKKRVKLPPESQRKFLRAMAYYSSSKFMNILLL